MDRDEAADILGVDVNADEEEIKERFRVMVKKNHPDKGGSSGVFKQIQTAKETLLTEEATARESSARPHSNAGEKKSDQRYKQNWQREQSNTRSAKQGRQRNKSSSNRSTEQRSTPGSKKESSGEYNMDYGSLKNKLPPQWRSISISSLVYFGFILGNLGIIFAIVSTVLAGISYSIFNVFIGDLPGGAIFVWIIRFSPYSLSLFIIFGIISKYSDDISLD